ncbi:hypothetical protein IFM89_014319 [Coptis chinensis]|uniref:Morc S5 domain-containing protein n=1 Tax=Coptis chinensis TaxID=261450 RepID=A0A835HSZ8_9MAGN|nr:hypothetical protein IFM89_014319 [Coptis chinensis]
MTFHVKQEKTNTQDYHANLNNKSLVSTPDISNNNEDNASVYKKRKFHRSGEVDLPLSAVPISQTPLHSSSSSAVAVVGKSCKQFWKAGDYEVTGADNVPYSSPGGLDRARVHPKFLHSNATSHKWALGALAELLDNSVDEICHGATYVNVDVLENKNNGNRMLLVQDNGGGMSPDTMRHCMSFGYSAKSKVANTIGQYGNGFKTSTMRLGADVIVFSRCLGKRPTISIGMLSYTFLRSTGKDDIVVPMLDYENEGNKWNKKMRSSTGDWNRNLETIIKWSPYSSEADLLQQFDLMENHGTRIILYNLWDDDQGELELDFGTDLHDIQIRGANRDESKIEMAKEFPNSKHFFTYQHSLRIYTSILYLRLPPEFRIILRGRQVQHHKIVNDMMLVEKRCYRPVSADGVPSNVSADVTIGFVKDAKYHIDVQGFSVYHKNRLIKPFWRVWNAAGSNGRGIIESSVSSSEKRSVSLSKETKHVLKGKSDEALPDNISRSDTSSQSTDTNITCNANERASCLDADLELENQQLMDKIKKMEESFSRDLELERHRCRILETQLKEKEQMSENLDKETDTIIEDFSEERDRRVNEEENLRNKMKEASNIIDELRKKVIVLVNMNSPFSKREH